MTPAEVRRKFLFYLGMTIGHVLNAMPILALYVFAGLFIDLTAGIILTAAGWKGTFNAFAGIVVAITIWFVGTLWRGVNPFARKGRIRNPYE